MSVLTKTPVRELISVPDEPVWRLSVRHYHDMISAGILTEDDPVELLEGWLITKMPKSPRHRVVTQLVPEVIANLLSDGWYVDAQEPITTNDSEPEPDVVVIKGARLDYLEYHPSPEDVGLLVEVSDATLRRDQTLKKQVYARSGIPVYWVVNLPQNQIEVYTEPVGDVYEQKQVYTQEQTVPVVIAGEENGRLAVADLLP